MKAITLSITLSRPLEPAELPAVLRAADAALPQAGTEAVILSGRLPTWVFAALAHLYHPRPAVAVFYPPAGGGVVVQTHSPAVREGDILAADGPEVKVEL